MRKQLRSLCLLLAILCAPVAAAAAPAKVLILRTAASRAEEAKLAGDVALSLSTDLGRHSQIEVIEPSDALVQLGDAAATKLGACNEDTACMVEIGGLLSIDYMIASSLGSLGDSYNVNIRLLSVREGAMAARASERVARTEQALGAATCALLDKVLAQRAPKDPRLSRTESLCVVSPPPPTKVAEAPAAPSSSAAADPALPEVTPAALADASESVIPESAEASVLPYAVFGVGAVAAIVGAVLGGAAYSSATDARVGTRAEIDTALGSARGYAAGATAAFVGAGVATAVSGVMLFLEF